MTDRCSALKRWIAEANDQGYVAVDTETDSLDAMQANLVGVSLATAPGKACYIPLGHKAAGGGLFGGETVAGQIALEDSHRPPEAAARGSGASSRSART